MCCFGVLCRQGKLPNAHYVKKFSGDFQEKLISSYPLSDLIHDCILHASFPCIQEHRRMSGSKSKVTSCRSGAE